MKACMREISKWCNEVSREPNEEVAEEANNAAKKVCVYFFRSMSLFGCVEKLRNEEEKKPAFHVVVSRENENFYEFLVRSWW